VPASGQNRRALGPAKLRQTGERRFARTIPAARFDADARHEAHRVPLQRALGAVDSPG
jgi:hypothetical protein